MRRWRDHQPPKRLGSEWKHEDRGSEVERTAERVVEDYNPPDAEVERVEQLLAPADLLCAPGPTALSRAPPAILDPKIEKSTKNRKISGDLWEPLGSLPGPPRAPRGPRKPSNTAENRRKTSENLRRTNRRKVRPGADS